MIILKRELEILTGYNNMIDILHMVGLKFKLIPLFWLVGGLSSWITQYMWDSPTSVFILAFMILVHFISGVYKAVTQGSFQASKLIRIFFSLFFTFSLLGISWHLSKIYPDLLGFLPGTVYLGYVVHNLLSIIENLVTVGFLPQWMGDILNGRLLSIRKMDNNNG